MWIRTQKIIHQMILIDTKNCYMKPAHYDPLSHYLGAGRPKTWKNNLAPVWREFQEDIQ